MRRIVTGAVKHTLVLSLVLAILVFTTSGMHAIFLDVYLLVLAAILLLALVRIARIKARANGSSQFERVLHGMRNGRAQPEELALERDIQLSQLNAFHLHLRVRPLLREIARHRLLKRYGVDLESEPARAREFVGEAAWELVRPERPAPADRLAPGPPLLHLRSVIADLERL